MDLSLYQAAIPVPETNWLADLGPPIQAAKIAGKEVLSSLVLVQLFRSYLAGRQASP